MKHVTPKKHLGQHFLTDLDIASKIASALTGHGNYSQIIEVGPGMGVLTDFLVSTPYKLLMVDIDKESVDYLNAKYFVSGAKIVNADFLQMNLSEIAPKMAVIGNFPYNISTQIMFKILEHKDEVTEVVGMFQKEVAERLASGPGNRDYGILSVLLQAYYDIEYLFTVPEHVFNPPPKVKSGVIRLKRNNVDKLPCDEVLFKKVIKISFQMRRKTLRNNLKSLNLPKEILDDSFYTKRPEELGVKEYIELTNFVQKYNAGRIA